MNRTKLPIPIPLLLKIFCSSALWRVLTANSVSFKVAKLSGMSFEYKFHQISSQILFPIFNCHFSH
ncbi:hypothetical protein AAHE18_10G195000 [Arachis hypogaea]